MLNIYCTNLAIWTTLIKAWFSKCTNDLQTLTCSVTASCVSILSTLVAHGYGFGKMTALPHNMRRIFYPAVTKKKCNIDVAAKGKSYVLKLGRNCIFIVAHGTEKYEGEHPLNKCVYLQWAML